MFTSSVIFFEVSSSMTFCLKDVTSEHKAKREEIKNV
ncbi:unnamed protein product [Schistosoma margrebowiei]|uniref:Uncharacterized protein n=1 Tax=Schistosoma margrebowiei TaxID=48269 RepID=A0A3P8CT05_9TREM|nr:unnamed protein product [Schistosoma margrebowiei]